MPAVLSEYGHCKNKIYGPEVNRVSQDVLRQIQDEVNKIIKGKENVVEMVLAAILAEIGRASCRERVSS